MKKFLLVLLIPFGLYAQDASLNFQIKFLKILMSSVGQYGITCPDAATKAKLESVGINIGPTFKLGLATSEDEVKSLKKAGKLVIVTNPAWLSAGGAISVTESKGKPQIRLDAANLKASGVALSDNIIKMANGN